MNLRLTKMFNIQRFRRFNRVDVVHVGAVLMFQSQLTPSAIRCRLLPLSIALEFRPLWMMPDRLNVHHPAIICQLQTFTQMQGPLNMLRNIRLRLGNQHRLEDLQTMQLHIINLSQQIHLRLDTHLTHF